MKTEMLSPTRGTGRAALALPTIWNVPYKQSATSPTPRSIAITRTLGFRTTVSSTLGILKTHFLEPNLVVDLAWDELPSRHHTAPDPLPLDHHDHLRAHHVDGLDGPRPRCVRDAPDRLLSQLCLDRQRHPFEMMCIAGLLLSTARPIRPSRRSDARLVGKQVARRLYSASAVYVRPLPRDRHSGLLLG